MCRSLLLSWAFLARDRESRRNTTAPTVMATTAAPMPMPALAPTVRPEDPLALEAPAASAFDDAAGELELDVLAAASVDSAD
jgi:hypothetical protein